MIEKYLNQVSNSEVKDWINTTLKATLKKQPEDQSEIEHILDFLVSDKAPKRLRKMSYLQAKKSAEKWVVALQKKGKDIDDSDEIKVVKKFKDGFKLVKLEGKKAYEREGKLMAHCVASYFDKESKIYSLRDEKNQPHCTIEVVEDGEGGINQIKGKGNGSIHPKYIKKVLVILRYFKLKVRESEMENLGYFHLESYEREVVKKVKGEKHIHKLKGKYYYFRGC